MRNILIDLSADNHSQQPNIFGGYAGEHNETVLMVKLPQRMIDIECSGYRFDFQTSEDNLISSPLIPVSELQDNIISFCLTEQLTIAGKLLFKIVAISSDANSVSLISKSNTVVLWIKDSPNGNVQLIDPNGHKDELQKMIDGRILEINSTAVDQEYNPESEKAQSGKAVYEGLQSLGEVVEARIIDVSKLIVDEYCEPNRRRLLAIENDFVKGAYINDNKELVLQRGVNSEENIGAIAYVLTEADKQEIADLVIASFPKWEGGSY